MRIDSLGRASSGIFMSMVVILLSACSDNEGATIAPIKIPTHYLSRDGVGPINAATPFNLRVMGEAFPNLNVAEETMYREGEKYPVITVRQSGQSPKALLSINPDNDLDKVFSVVVHDNTVGNRLEHALGTKFSSIYPYDNLERCAQGMEEFAGKVLCLAPKSSNILYQFGGRWDGPIGEMPPLKVLADWELQSFIWKPPVQTAAIQSQP